MVIFKMLYFLLFLHFGFYVFFIMCFAAYVYAATENQIFKSVSALILVLYSMVEFFWIGFVYFYLNMAAVVWAFWLAGVFLSLIIIVFLRLKKKVDMTIWIPFSILFSPIIIIPVLIFLRSVRFIKKFSYISRD
jgi:hypothetical protein